LYTSGLDIVFSVKPLTEAALLGKAIEHGLARSDYPGDDKTVCHLGACLCWVHMERGIRRLPGNTALQRQEIIEACRKLCGDYYRQLSGLLRQPSETGKGAKTIAPALDEIFGQRYAHHYLNLAMQQFLRP